MSDLDRQLVAPTRPGQKPPAYSMRALGRAGLPEAIAVGDVTYTLVRAMKHDFFAATGLYVSGAGRKVVCKIGRTTPFFGLPLAWLGRWLCQRELRFYARLHDLPNVPAVLGTVGDTGFVHAYVEGRPLSKDVVVPNGFFDQLDALLADLHRRNLAYVDTNKPQNILLGDDGRPHLIDFQISFDLDTLGGDHPLGRLVLRALQREDRYHVLKHKRRLRPDELSADERERAGRRSGVIRLHRVVTKPYFKLRRAVFGRLRASGRLLPEGTP